MGFLGNEKLREICQPPKCSKLLDWAWYQIIERTTYNSSFGLMPSRVITLPRRPISALAELRFAGID